MTKFLKYLSLFAVIAIAFAATDASASVLGQGDNVFDTVTSRMITTFKNVRAVIFIVGGFGLVLDDLMKIRGWNQLPAQLFARFGMGEIRQPFYDLIKLESLQSFLIHIKNPFYTGKV